MSEIRKSVFSFVGFYIKESHLFFYKSKGTELKIEIHPKGKLLRQSNSFVLELRLIVNNEDNDTLIDVIGEGSFLFEEFNEKLSSFLNLNAPALMFPYLRSYISSLTAQSGVSTLTLPTLNLSALAEELKQNTETLEE